MKFLGQLTYTQAVSRVAKRLHLDAILRPVYRWWTTSVPRVVRVRPLGLSYKMRISPREVSDNEWDFDRGERDFAEALKIHLHPGETALDVGAHFGEFTLVLSKILGPTGRVLSFEPEASAYQRLVDHVKLNGLTNVQMFMKALGDENRADRIFTGGGFCPSIVPLENDTIQRSVSKPIEIVRGDTFFASEMLPIPHAVKIDVEGFEYAVLRGLCGTLASPTCRLACVEIHPEALPPGVNAETITELLRSLGFGQFRTEHRVTELHVVAVKPTDNP
jgi:FkbM family methyltransferase